MQCQLINTKFLIPLVIVVLGYKVCSVPLPGTTPSSVPEAWQLEIAEQYPVEFLMKVKENLLKAIALEKANQSTSARQFFPNYGQDSGYGTNNGGFWNYLNRPREPETEEDYEEEEHTTLVHPLSVLAGIAGVVNGITSLNSEKVFSSAINFFPTNEKVQATNVVANLFGYSTITPPTTTPNATLVALLALERLKSTTVATTTEDDDYY